MTQFFMQRFIYGFWETQNFFDSGFKTFEMLVKLHPKMLEAQNILYVEINKIKFL